MAYESDVGIVLDILRKIGIDRLGYWDGCCCGEFHIHGVNIDVACGKGRNKGVYISARYDDFCDPDTGKTDENLLQPVADEVVAQLEEKSSRAKVWPVHFRAWEKSDG